MQKTAKMDPAVLREAQGLVAVPQLESSVLPRAATMTTTVGLTMAKQMARRVEQIGTAPHHPRKEKVIKVWIYKAFVT